MVRDYDHAYNVRQLKHIQNCLNVTELVDKTKLIGIKQSNFSDNLTNLTVEIFFGTTESLYPI